MKKAVISCDPDNSPTNEHKGDHTTCLFTPIGVSIVAVRSVICKEEMLNGEK